MKKSFVKLGLTEALPLPICLIYAGLIDQHIPQVWKGPYSKQYHSPAHHDIFDFEQGHIESSSYRHQCVSHHWELHNY